MVKPYAEWIVGDESYKLKLSTNAIVTLESKFKTNLINIVSNMDGGVPMLSVMLTVVHQAMQEFNHGIKLNKVYELFDKYIEEGGSQVDFMSSVFLNVFIVSGFLSPAQAEAMQQSLATATEQIQQMTN